MILQNRALQTVFTCGFWMPLWTIRGTWTTALNVHGFEIFLWDAISSLNKAVQCALTPHSEVCLLADRSLCQICRLKSRYADCNTLDVVYRVLSLDFSLKTEAHQKYKLKGVSPRDNPNHIPHKSLMKIKTLYFSFVTYCQYYLDNLTLSSS